MFKIEPPTNDDTVPIEIDLTQGNIILSGRPRSGMDNMLNEIIAQLDINNKSYTIIEYDDNDGIEELFEILNNRQEIVIIKDNLLLQDIFRIKPFKAQIIWVVPFIGNRHMSRLIGLFASKYYAFATLRNNDFSLYPQPYSIIGDLLPENFYVDVYNGHISSLENTTFKI